MQNNNIIIKLTQDEYERFCDLRNYINNAQNDISLQDDLNIDFIEDVLSMLESNSNF